MLFLHEHSGDWKANLISANKVDEIEWKEEDKLLIYPETDCRQ